MKTFFIVSTSLVNLGFFVFSKYNQLPQIYVFKTKKKSLDFCEAINKKANDEYKESIILTENENFKIGVKTFLTKY